MHAPHTPDVDSFIAGALERVSAGARDQAVEIGTGQTTAPLGCTFRSAQMVQPGALADCPAGAFQFVLAARSFDQMYSVIPVIECFRQSARLLRESGLLCARLNCLPDSATRFTTGDLTELSRDLNFQILAVEGVGSKNMWMLLRKRAPGWRLNLSDHAALASAHIVRVTNSWDNGPVVPSRGRYSSITISIDGLPIDMDLFDLEVFIGGIRAQVTFISEPDARGLQQVRAMLPSLEQTGLIPVELRWFGERLTPDLAYVRVIPPGPIVPRIARIAGGATRLAGITVTIEELARPDEFAALINGVPVWGVEIFCTDPSTQTYDVRFQLPDEISAGTHEIEMTAGRHRLPPVAVEID